MTAHGDGLTRNAVTPTYPQQFVRPPAARVRLRLGDVVLTTLALATLAIVLLTDSLLPFGTRLTGWALWTLCLYPLWDYVRIPRGARRPIPFLPIVGLLFAWYFARPLVFGTYNEHWRIKLDPTKDYDIAARLALAGWALLLIGWKIGVSLGVRRPTTLSNADERKMGIAALILSTFGVLGILLQLSLGLPTIVGGFARLAGSLGYLGIALLTMNIASGKGTLGKKVWLILVCATLLILQIATATISGVFTTAAVVILSHIAVTRKISSRLIVFAIVSVLATMMIKGTTEQLRKATWFAASRVSPTERLRIAADFTANQIETHGISGALEVGWRSTVTRSANLDLLAEILNRTPSQIPFWNGHSYVSLVGFAIPRFLWPDKPEKNLGQRFGHRYSLLSPHDTHTSFNLPYFVEFYTNFGYTGVILGMLLIGFIYGQIARIVNNPRQSTLMTIFGLVLLLPLLNIESDFSLTFGGLAMDGAALWLVVRTIGSSRKP